MNKTLYDWRIRGRILKPTNSGEKDNPRWDLILFRQETFLELGMLGQLTGQALEDYQKQNHLEEP